MNKLILSFCTLMFILISCSSEPEQLPILGHRTIEGKDTIYHTIPDFKFMNQDSQWITNETFAGKAYVVDFFFTTCPTICPKVKEQMLRVYDRFSDQDSLVRMFIFFHCNNSDYRLQSCLRKIKSIYGSKQRKQVITFMLKPKRCIYIHYIFSRITKLNSNLSHVGTKS